MKNKIKQKKENKKRIKSGKGYGFLRIEDNTLMSTVMPCPDFKDFVERTNGSYKTQQEKIKREYKIIEVRITPLSITSKDK